MLAMLPYPWVNELLLDGSAALLCASIVLLFSSFVFRRFSRRRLRLGALGSFLLGLGLGASNYGFVFYVQLPAYSRAVMAVAQARADASSLVKSGDQAPLFRVKSLDGTEVDLDRLRGKTVLLVFFATWCGPCTLELPHVQEIWEANRNRSDFALVVVGREETADKLATFKAEHGYTFPIAADPNRAVYSRYAKELIPRSYLIASDGRICFVSTGFSEDRLAELQEQLAKQLGPQKA